MAELLTGTPRDHIARMWPKHLEHLAPEGNTMGQGLIDPDEGVVCNCGEVLGFPAVQDEADYVAAEPEQPDTSGAQTGEPDDEPDWTPQLTDREHASDPDGDLWGPDGEAIPAQPLVSNRLGEEETATEAGWNDLVTAPPDEAQAIPHGTRSEPGWVDGAWSPDDEAQARQDYAEPPAEPKGVMPYRDHGVVEAEDPLAARVVTIDPTQPYGPLDVEHQLLDIAQRLERGVHFQRYWEERQFAADATYTNKAARERWNHRGDGAKDVRDAAVHMACQEEWTELRLCDAMVRAVRETMHNLRSLQTGYQTVARSVTESTKNPAGSRGRP